MSEVNYGELYKPDRSVKVIKKDNTREEFNVQKVINAVGKSAYRALTDFTEEEKRSGKCSRRCKAHRGKELPRLPQL